MSCMPRTGCTALAEVATLRSMPRCWISTCPAWMAWRWRGSCASQGFDRPLIAITARADAEAEPQAQQAGFDHFMRKPVTTAMLAALLDRAVPAPPWEEAEPAQPVPL